VIRILNLFFFKKIANSELNYCGVLLFILMPQHAKCILYVFMLILHNQVHRCCFLLQFMLDCFFSFLSKLSNSFLLSKCFILSFNVFFVVASFPFTDLICGMGSCIQKKYLHIICAFFADEINRI